MRGVDIKNEVLFACPPACFLAKEVPLNVMRGKGELKIILKLLKCVNYIHF
jgi:hypothetical protein